MLRRLHILAISSLVLLSGCATRSAVTHKAPGIGGLEGIYHRVRKDQTLWSISQMYGVDIERIVKINNISDATTLEAGEAIFIPSSQSSIFTDSIVQNKIEDFIWPFKGTVVSSFGERAGNMVNKGINVRTNKAVDVLASRSGIVVFANENLRGYGRAIIIDHSDGFMTVYTSLSEILVKPGDYIDQGFPVARVDNGVMHFEIRKSNIAHNPFYYLPRI